MIHVRFRSNAKECEAIVKMTAELVTGTESLEPRHARLRRACLRQLAENLQRVQAAEEAMRRMIGEVVIDPYGDDLRGVRQGGSVN